MKKTPPKLATKILRWFCNIEFLEEIEGDLNEQFNERLENQGYWKARLLYIQDVFHTIRSYPVKRNQAPRQSQSTNIDLFRHFLRITFRNIVRSKSTAFINITGLAISVTSFLLIALFVIDETSFDSFHPNADNVFRISYSYKRYGDGVQETDARAAGLWSVALKESMPEVKRFTRFSRFGYPGTIRYENLNKTFVEQEFFWVDTTYTDIFKLEIIKGGEASRVLRNPHNLLITEFIAQKYFGDEDPVGKHLIYSRDGMDFEFTVAGVFKNYPTNAHFHPNFIASNLALTPLWKRNNEDRVNSWRDAFTYSYLEMDEGTDENKLHEGLRKVFDQHLGDDAKLVWPAVVRLKDIHLTPGKVIELEAPGEKSNNYIFGSIGILILLIASANYMNLATARSIKRSKEVGLRKTLGVSKSTLVIQFIGESVLITGCAVVLSILFLTLLLPYFNDVTSKTFTVSVLLNQDILLALICVPFVLGLISGIYPAFYLSSFNPVQVLKGKFDAGSRAENLRKALVVFQFSITLFLITGTVVIDQQLEHMNNTKLTELQDQVLSVRLFGFINESEIGGLINNIEQNPSVAEVSLGTHLPRQDHYGWIDTRVKAPSLGETEYIWQQLDGSANLPAMFNLELIAGRTFSETNPADSTNVIVNESAVKDLGILPVNALGLIIENPFTKEQKTVIGVVRDFNYASARKNILPLMINNKKSGAETLYIRLAGTSYPQIIDSIEKTWKKTVPASPFEYWFLSDQFTMLYKLERQTDVILKFFAGLAIVIGCLGLFGLASYTAEQKTKEIGIRKVLGASAKQLLFMLVSRFIKLIIISFMIGIPVAYFLVNQWLENFAYKVDVSALFFIVPGIGILVIAFLTVSIETLRAALANPVESIRHE